MAEKATIKTASGARVRGEVTREKKWSPSGAQLLALVAMPLSGATWKPDRTTVKTDRGGFFTGRKVR